MILLKYALVLFACNSINIDNHPFTIVLDQLVKRIILVAPKTYPWEHMEYVDRLDNSQEEGGADLETENLIIIISYSMK